MALPLTFQTGSMEPMAKPEPKPAEYEIPSDIPPSLAEHFTELRFWHEMNLKDLKVSRFHEVCCCCESWTFLRLFRLLLFLESVTGGPS